MFGYYFGLALRSLRRTPVLTALMVVAIGLGIGASMTMLTVLRLMTADPLPGRSAQLYYPQLDPQDMQGFKPDGDPPEQLAWIDAMNLLHARRGARQVAMVHGQVVVRPPQGEGRAFFASARYASADFFPMFGVPFLHGGGWSADDDARQARVAVLSRELADKLYGADRAVGQELRLGKDSFRIIGVIDHWNPQPHFYDVTLGKYQNSEDVFLPLETAIALKQPRYGNMSCWGDLPTDENMKNADCVWLQFWVRLDTPAQAKDYREFLVHYSEQQKALGRFQRPPNVRLHDLMGWLDYNHVVPGSVQMQTLLALGFLLVCLVNTVALLLVKFLRRGGELSVRRALGASRRAVFVQLLAESALIGLAGGAVGLLLSLGGLWLLRQQPAEYASLARADGPMLLGTLALAVAATLSAAVFPAWRACRLAPARLLKLQ
ncbi:ABC transporter permease [Fulvimonas soli]|jgi:putative ABC transport system permease protein|uniref:Putative ABC transport system permease protein n=1 Tax=Fulvimonas soli TaxID=155197 RepID=A0A316I5H4_9GAMM|nr:ABC transporter permease [Fulvimonas soli]PWK88712.1 putative ABC transport system permease protein [Fulvimonas soli]TNY25469.1 ABC transporter ATP-binding protein [Fulvimonas soli]